MSCLLCADYSDEHFYQLGLRQFGAFNRIRLDPPPLLKDLLALAASYEEGIMQNGLNPDKVVKVRHCAILNH